MPMDLLRLFSDIRKTDGAVLMSPAAEAYVRYLFDCPPAFGKGTLNTVIIDSHSRYKVYARESFVEGLFEVTEVWSNQGIIYEVPENERLERSMKKRIAVILIDGDFDIT